MIQRRKPLLRKKPLIRTGINRKAKTFWSSIEGNLMTFHLGAARPKRKPIAKMSAKRKVESRIYSKKRRAFLEMHPYCETRVTCAGNPAIDVHHVYGRTGKNYLDDTTWLSSCRPCHNWIHNNPGKARERGLLR